MNPPDSVFEQLGGVPLAERVRTVILDAILAKRFEHRLPNEDDLASMLKVSRTTVRAALQGLESDGIITRRRAIGTTINSHVRRSALALQRLVSFADLLKERGHTVRVEASPARAEEAPDDMRAAFGTDIPGGPVFLTDTTFTADGHPAIWIRDVVPWKLLEDDTRLPPPGNPEKFDFTRPYLVKPVLHAVAEIRPVVSKPGATPLPIAEGAAFTRLLERHYAADGELMAVSLVDVDDDYVVFEVVRRS